VTVQDGFDQFVAEQLDRLLRYATALTCDPYLAQDIVQDVLPRVRHRWSRIGSLPALDLYLRRLVTNDYLSWRRSRAVRDIASEHSTLDAMHSRIAVLPRKQRAAILLRYYEDRTDAEIAEVLGCGAGTVHSHLSRALDTLRAATAAGTRPPGSPVKEALS
jgi:RNA polymerase sigma factor (sigma-70 family)